MKKLCCMSIFMWMIIMISLNGTDVLAENRYLSDSLITNDYAHEPDSVYTREYIHRISFTEPYRALKLIDEMEKRELLSDFRLDQMRGLVYQNGLNMYRTALTYSLRAYHNDSIRQNPDEALLLLELITDQYNVTGNYTESTRYAVEGLELAEQLGNIRSEANLLLYIGINNRDMGLKNEADKYIEQSVQFMEKAIKDSYEWKSLDDLIYIYGIKITFALEDKEYRKAIDLLPRYEKLMERLKACPDVPEGYYDMRSASAYAAYAYIFVANGQPDKGDEFYQKYLKTDWASSHDGKQMRFDYLVATKRYREVLQVIDEDKQFLREQGDTINYFYIERNLNFEAQAYMGIADYKAAALTYKQMYILSDSLRIREKQNGVLEFATLYETKEKEAQLLQQSAKLRENRIINAFSISIILLLGFLLWRNIRHSRIVKVKNKAMVGTIESLLGYKEELFRKKEENLALNEKLQTAESELRNRKNTKACILPTKEIRVDVVDVLPVDAEVLEKEPNSGNMINDQSLFDRAEHEIISHQLFLQPDFSREELIKIVYIPKNKFALLFKQYAGTSFSKYINNLRLEHAAKLLKMHREYTIDAVAQECGMSSQTFYRLFSGKFGVTPTEFQTGLQRVKNEDNTD